VNSRSKRDAPVNLAGGMPAGSGQAVLARRSRLVEPLLPWPRTHLLDYGCGNGAQTMLFAQVFDQITGVDVNDGFLDELEPSPLQGRKFSLSEAIGRTGQGALKGASPVSPSVQLILGIQGLLEIHLPDQEGSLTRTILSQLEANLPLLAEHHGHPQAALGQYLRQILDSETNLKQLVRDTDARWGRDYDEQPYFEKPGQPADPEDPYTNEKVELLLKLLFEQLTQ